MKTYELMTIIKPNMDTDEVEKIIAKLEETVKTLGGEVLETDKVGRKKLAFDVDNFRDGFFVVQQLKLDAAKVVDFKRQLKLNDSILRTMFMDIKKVKA